MGIRSCDMVKDCPNPVTHLGEKGYVYCAHHASRRKGTERVRKMAQWEITRLSFEQPLTYKRGPKPTILKRESEILLNNLTTENRRMKSEIDTFRNASPSLCSCHNCMDLRREFPSHSLPDEAKAESVPDDIPWKRMLQVSIIQDWLLHFEPDEWVELEDICLLVRNGPDDKDYRLEFDQGGLS